MRLPAHCTALGKCLLSRLPHEAVRAALGHEPYERRTANTLTTWSVLARRPRRDPRGRGRRLRGGAGGRPRLDRGAGPVDRRARHGRDQRLAPGDARDPRLPPPADRGAAADRRGDRRRDGAGRPAVTVAAATAEIAGDADRFARALAAEIASEPALRYQGMPSDGDSEHAYRALGPRRLDRRALAGRARRPRADLAGYARLRRAVRLPLAAAVRLPAVGQDDRQRAASLRLARASGAPDPRDRRRTDPVLPGLLRARRGLGPRPRCAPARAWTATASSSTAARSGPPAPSTPTGSTWPVRTDPDRPRHRGISVLVAPISTPGIRVLSHPTLGGGTIGELELADVEIGADQLVGELHGGWKLLMGTLDYERVTSEKVGTVMWLLDALATAGRRARAPARADAPARGRGGRPVARPPRRRAARAAAAGERAELDGEACGRRADAGGRAVRGGVARSRRPAGGGHRDARADASPHSSAPSVATTISGGAAEIQRTVIARRELGLAR